MSKSKPGCSTCDKSALSLLLLRPSVVALEKALEPAGADQVKAEDALVAGLTPTRKPTESRYVLRLLRAGYVHVYTPKPPAGVKQWRVFRVTDEADLVPEQNAWFKQPDANVPCTSPDHKINGLGLKVVDIPMAHKTGDVWIAYSANLWNKKLRARNAANPKVMQKVSLTAKSPNTFTPTSENLKDKVLECAISELWINRSSAQDFRFNSLVDRLDSLAKKLEQLAALHPKTKGKQLAVVLRDPAGLAAELNGLRLRRHELALREIEKPANAHPLNSSNALLGMRKSLLDANMAESFEQVSPIKTRQAFQQSACPAGTEWRALTPEQRQVLVDAASDDNWFNAALKSPYRRVFESADLGRVVYPDHDARAEAWAKEKTDETWKKIADRYDEAARANWVRNFESRMKSQHYDPLARYEADWRAAATDAATLAYFAQHFDDQDPNDPKEQCSPGSIYCRDSHYVHAPEPITGGALRTEYLAMLDKPVTDDSAVVTRALVGNQQDLFASLQAFLSELHTQATGDAGAVGMRDKAYDFMKGLHAENATLKKYSWLGEALCAFSVGQLSALSAAALAIASESKALSPVIARSLTKLQTLWGVQQAVELSVQGALSKAAPKVPVLLSMKVDVNEALAVLRAHGANVSKNEVKRLRRGGSVQLSLLTDTDALKAAQGNVDTLLKGTSGTVNAGPSAKTTAAAAGSTVVLSKDQFLRLYAEQSKFGAKGANAVREMLSKSVSDLRAMTLTLDGRLAIGSIIVQGIGLVNGLGALADAKTQKDVRDAWFGIYDSTAGAIGGLLELWAVAVNARSLAGAGAQGAARSMSLASLRFIGNIAGAAGGAVNAVAAFAKATDHAREGNTVVSQFYLASSVAFGGTAVTSSIVGVGVAADWIVARQVGGAVAQRAATAIAVRFGAQGTAALLGLSVSGWGLVLLGAGVLFQVGAMVLTPTPLQKWASRSYFGKGGDKFPKGDWKAEKDALLEAVGAGTQEAHKAASVKPESTPDFELAGP